MTLETFNYTTVAVGWPEFLLFSFEVLGLTAKNREIQLLLPHTKEKCLKFKSSQNFECQIPR